MIVALLLLLLAQNTDSPRTQPAKLPTGKYTTLKISGDLDTELYLRSISTELDKLRAAPLVILELDGNRARTDLVARLATRIATNSPPVAVYLKDTFDKQVGTGQALLAGSARACFIDPETRIRFSLPDDLRFLAAPETAWESIEQEATGPLWRKLSQQNADLTLPPLLLHPQRDTWAVPVTASEAWKLSPASPAGGQSGPEPRQIAWAQDSRIDIDADTAVALRLATGKTTSAAPILTACGLSPRSSSSRISIESKFPAAAAALPRILDDAKLALRRIASTLTLKSPDRTLTADDYRKAGQSALTQISTASRELDRAESLLADYPELNRRPTTEKPSRTDKGPFRPIIESLRKDLDKHRTTARDFASR